LIGARLLERDTEVAALRRIRDDLLGTTEAGRQWIALFEQRQTSLMRVVLEDARLSEEAARLLETIGRLLDDDQAVMTTEHVERASSLIGQLQERAESDEVRRDLAAAQRELVVLADRTINDAIEHLMRQGPRLE
jgi:hypothetical protein